MQYVIQSRGANRPPPRTILATYRGPDRQQSQAFWYEPPARPLPLPRGIAAQVLCQARTHPHYTVERQP